MLTKSLESKRTLLRAKVPAASMAMSALAALTLGACGSGEEESAASEPSAAVEALSTDAASVDLLPADIRDSGTIRVGTSTDTAPFNFTSGSTTTGIVPGLVESMEQVLGVDIELVPMDFPGLIPGLQAGKIDAAWTVLNDLAEREQMLDFVDYMKTSSSLLVAEGNPDELTGIDDSLCGTSVGTLRGSLYLPLLEAQAAACEEAGAPLQVDLFDDSTSAQVQVRSGKSSGFVGLATVIRYSASTVDDGKSFDAVEANILPGYIGIALPKGSELTAAFQSALVKVVESGNYDEVLESYDASSEALTADQIVVNGVGTGQLK